MNNSNTDSPLRYSENGRSGTIYFQSAETSLEMWYELAMPPAIIIMGIPEPKYWEAHTKTPLSKREEILGFIGEQVIKDKLSGEGYFLIDDNILSICRGKNPNAN
ncbi:hypothetical protein [Dyadobacter frigoris]|uniref:Uncharacterized protein n=1 Tax=Dyadobacter frigoris TaxID=2576211 RepID=A0A4U6D5P1_9BACT|nr:hypothetical protein [Dyadobacter frigoris]TKT89344.1 hypothetical protein FDK13_23620 [Dyadobacter frigoris]GLU55521.1 hypothetical protein Dfri01_49820 [Dyadobacter frigoris]